MNIDGNNVESIRNFVKLADEKGTVNGLKMEEVEGTIDLEQFREIDVNNDDIIDGSEIDNLRDELEEYDKQNGGAAEGESAPPKSEKKGFFQSIIDFFVGLFTHNSKGSSKTESTGGTPAETREELSTIDITPRTGVVEGNEPAALKTPVQNFVDKLKNGGVDAVIDGKTTGLSNGSYNGKITMSGDKLSDSGWPQELKMTLPSSYGDNAVMKLNLIGDGKYETSAKNRHFEISVGAGGNVVVNAADVDQFKGPEKTTGEAIVEAEPPEVINVEVLDEEVAAAEPEAETETEPVYYNGEVFDSHKWMSDGRAFLAEFDEFIQNGSEEYKTENREVHFYTNSYSDKIILDDGTTYSCSRNPITGKAKMATVNRA